MDRPTLTPQQFRRNFALGVIDGMLFRLSYVLSDPALVLTWFITQLTPSPFIVGLLTPLNRTSVLIPQLALCGYMQRRRRRLVVYAWSTVARIIIWALLVVAVFVLGNRNPQVLLWTFLVLFGLYWFAMGIGSLGFSDAVAKSIVPQRRGAFFAWRDFLGGILGLGASRLVSELLDESRGYAFPTNYGILFGVAWVAIAVGGTCMSSLTEPDTPLSDMPADLVVGIPFRQMGRVLRDDANFRLVVAARAMITLATLAMPFYTVYSKETLQAPASSAGLYVAAYTAAQVISSLVWGWVRDRYDCRAVALGTALLLLPLPLVPLLLGTRISYGAFALVFLLLGFAQGGVQMEQVSFVIDVAPAKERILYLAVANSLLGLLTLSFAGAGLIAERFGVASMFVISLLAAAVSCFLIAAVRMPPKHTLAENG